MDGGRVPDIGCTRQALGERKDGNASGRRDDDAAVADTTLEALDSDGIPVQQRAFLSLARLVGLLDDTALIAVPNDFTKDIVETRLRDRVTSTLGSQLGREVRLAVTVDPSLADAATHEGPHGARRASDRPRVTTATSCAPPTAAARSTTSTSARTRSTATTATTARMPRSPPAREGVPGLVEVPGARRPRPNNQVPEQVELTRLNPKYTFDTFVIGASNRFAHAAAVAVAEAPAKAYNPLFIYGDSGLGKTHLLHAIGHYARNLFPHVKVRYVNSEEFTNDFINSIRDDKAANFQRRYRDVDVLLIDDIQFLQGKVQTQEEFFHTFNTLHNANKQVVITSDVPPKLLSGFEARMRSRFEMGLLTDVQPPDLETRIAILRKKAIQERLSVPDDVLEFIASRISTNIRELEGALIRVTAFASLNRQPVDMSLAEIVLRDLIPDDASSQVTPGDDHGPDRRVLRADPRRPAGTVPLARARHGAADRDVPVPRAHRHVAAEDRPAVRRPRPHDRHARRQEDPPAHGRAARDLQPGHRADEPDQAAVALSSASRWSRTVPTCPQVVHIVCRTFVERSEPDRGGARAHARTRGPHGPAPEPRIHLLCTTVWTTPVSPSVTRVTSPELSTEPVDECGQPACRGGRRRRARWTPCERHPAVNTLGPSSTGSSTGRPHGGSPCRPARIVRCPQDPQDLPLR